MLDMCVGKSALKFLTSTSRGPSLHFPLGRWKKMGSRPTSAQPWDLWSSALYIFWSYMFCVIQTVLSSLRNQWKEKKISAFLPVPSVCQDLYGQFDVGIKNLVVVTDRLKRWKAARSSVTWKTQQGIFASLLQFWELVDTTWGEELGCVTCVLKDTFINNLFKLITFPRPNEIF